MRTAIVSDIHGNLTAFKAVLADLRDTAPDAILHGGDLADFGSSPVEIVDRIRDLGWQGVIGNTDEMHARPELLEEFVAHSSAPESVWDAVREVAAATRAVLGEERIAWLAALPRIQILDTSALVHASPSSPWHAPGPEAGAAEFESVYAPLGKPLVIYGHIHQPFIRHIPLRQPIQMTVANAGSVGLSYDGDRRACYLLIDDSEPTIRRVEYDVEKEIQALAAGGLPRAGWIARSLRAAAPQMP